MNSDEFYEFWVEFLLSCTLHILFPTAFSIISMMLEEIYLRKLSNFLEHFISH